MNLEEETKTALELLVQLAQYEPLFLRPCLPLLQDTMLAIGKATSLDDGMWLIKYVLLLIISFYTKRLDVLQ